MVTHHWWEDFASLSLPKAKNSLCITAPDYPHKTGGDINMPNSYFYAWSRFWRKDSICDLEINFDRSFIKQSISHTFSKLCWKLFLIFPPKTTSNYLSPKSNLASVVQTVKKWVVRGKKVSINNRFFQSHPWIHVILQIIATDKLIDLDPWNFDAKNVKQYVKRGKKEKDTGMTMRGTPSV